MKISICHSRKTLIQEEKINRINRIKKSKISSRKLPLELNWYIQCNPDFTFLYRPVQSPESIDFWRCLDAIDSERWLKKYSYYIFHQIYLLFIKRKYSLFEMRLNLCENMNEKEQQQQLRLMHEQGKNWKRKWTVNKSLFKVKSLFDLRDVTSQSLKQTQRLSGIGI